MDYEFSRDISGSSWTTVLPVNAIVGTYISNMFEDRQILLGSEILVLLGILLSFDFISTYIMPQYVSSALITLVAAEVLEVMASHLARGTYNGCLLSTEAGTLALVVADGTITLAGYLGISRLLNLTLLPSLAICFGSNNPFSLQVAKFCSSIHR